MSKTLHTQRRLAYLVFNNLKNTPPKNFPTLDEMDLTVNDILPVFEGEVEGYIQIRKHAEDINLKLSINEVTQKEADDMIKELNIDAAKFEGQHKNDEVEVEFENSPFNTLFQQFERWGKEWFRTLEDFVDFRKQINKANSQSGKKNSDDKGEKGKEKEKD